MSEELNNTQQNVQTQEQAAASAPPPASLEPAERFLRTAGDNPDAQSNADLESLFKEAGITAEGDFKSSLKAFKEWQDSQKTELQKATDGLTTEQRLRTEAESKALRLERELLLRDKNVPADKTDAYIKLAEAYMGDDADFTAALELAIQSFPVIAGGVPGAGGNPVAATGGGQASFPQGVITF